MQLHEVPNKTYVKIINENEDISCPPDSREIQSGDIIFFDHIDGMYSFCKNSNGDLVHLAAWTEVEIVE